MQRRVLLIDDERLQFRLVQQLFAAFGADSYELDWHDTYEAGLEALLQGGYDACLLDFRLGGHDGLELIREATAQGCRVPIIFLTAETGTDVDVQAMNAGALDYLIKGEVNAKLLERSVRYALKLGETLDELRRLATRDALTGLLSRRVFDQTLTEEIDRSRRFGRSFALILTDIDHFKRVNDTHGHPTGDAVLREVAQSLQAGLRNVDRIMRYGGEEFAIVVLEADMPMALDLAQRLADRVRSTSVAAQGVSLPITLSMGVAVFPGDGADGAALVKAADEALYAAKAGGRDRVCARSKV
ncbi:MAG: hypothetical protein RIS54_1942 [Verrucomicrobiota bacterium]|jgi:diguanylate cyclase (GGDEF)-like protein